MTQVNAPIAGSVVETKPFDKPQSASVDVDTQTIVSGGHSVLAGFICTVLMFAWMFFFVIGYGIPTFKHREFLQKDLTSVEVGAWSSKSSQIFESLVLVWLAYTPMNLIFLCCFGSLLGCFGRIAAPAAIRIMRGAGQSDAAAGLSARAAGRNMPSALGAIAWGFFVSLLVISGTMIVSGDLETMSKSPDHYVRVAATSSILAFVVGWRPQFIERMVRGVGDSKLGGARTA